MDKIVKNKKCKKCNLEESDICVFDVQRRVCRKCRYESKRDVQYFKDYYQIHIYEILQQKAITYKIK